MDPDMVKAALEALKNGDADAALMLLENLIAAAAGAGPADEAPAGEALAKDAPKDAPEDAPEATAALALLRDLTGCHSVREAGETLRGTIARVSQLDADRAALDLSARRELIADLVKLGAEVPSTAWEGEPKDRTPCARLAGESLESLRTRVKLLRGNAPRGPQPPASGERAQIKLSARELSECAKRGISPEEFAARKAGAVRRI